MTQAFLSHILPILGITLALNGCSTATPIVAQWRNPAEVSISFQQVMIAGATGDVSIRRSFEDEFVTQLAAMGVQAVPSYRYLPENQETTELSFKKAAQEAGVDGLLLMRPIGVEEKTNYPAVGPGISFGIFGSNAAAEWYGLPGSSGPSRYNEYTSETALYDLTNNELIWTGTIKAKEPTNVQATIRSYVQAVTKALAEQNVFPKK